MIKLPRSLSLAALSALALTLAGCGGSGDASDASSSAPADNAAAAAAGGKTLTTEIPPEQIEGTPMPIKVPNLQQAPKKAPAIQVPEGVVLLSAGKPVTGSDDFPIVGELAYITDGDKEAGQGYYVELLDGLQWVQIDLGAPAEIYAIWVWHYHLQARAYHDVVVQISNDPNFENNVTTVFNNDYDKTAGLGQGGDAPYVESRFGKLISVDGVTGQYVRLYSNGSTSDSMNHYIEVEVFGSPAS